MLWREKNTGRTSKVLESNRSPWGHWKSIHLCLGISVLFWPYPILFIIVVSNVNFLWFPTTNLFVAFLANFLAEQNPMSCLGAQLTFHFEHKTPAGPSLRDMNLSGIINICTDDWQGRSKTMRSNLLSMIWKPRKTTQSSIVSVLILYIRFLPSVELHACDESSYSQDWFRLQFPQK